MAVAQLIQSVADYIQYCQSLKR